MSDLLLQPTVEGGEVLLDENGDFILTDALLNSAYISAMTSREWWGNELQEVPFVSRLDEIGKGTLTNQKRLQAIDSLEQALAWMVDDGIASEINVSAVISSPTRLDVTIESVKPDGGRVSATYEQAWAAQRTEYE